MVYVVRDQFQSQFFFWEELHKDLLKTLQETHLLMELTQE